MINPDGSMIDGYFMNNVYCGQISPNSTQVTFNHKGSPNQSNRGLRASLSSNFSQGSLISRTSLVKKANQIESQGWEELNTEGIISPFMSPNMH